MTSDDLILGLVVLAAPAVTFFPIVYWFRNWRATPQGQGLMVRSVGDMIVIDMIIATLVFGEHYPGRDTIRIVGFTLFAVGTWYVFITLLLSRGARNYPAWTMPRRTTGTTEGPGTTREAQERPL